MRADKILRRSNKALICSLYEDSEIRNTVVNEGSISHLQSLFYHINPESCRFTKIYLIILLCQRTFVPQFVQKSAF
jgi:hypothetical protein